MAAAAPPPPSGTPRRPAQSERAVGGPRTALLRYITVLLPAVLVFGVEFVRHEELHGTLPVMLGNAITAAIAFAISLAIFVPLYRRLDAADARVRRLQIERAVAEERERIARELHDGISQALFFLNVEVGMLQRSLGESRDAGTVGGILHEIEHAIRETADRVRDTIFDLRTGPEPGQSFGDWLEMYARRWSDVHNVAVTVEVAGLASGRSGGEELQAMAAIREILHDTARHVGVHAIAISATRSGAGVVITAAETPRSLPAGSTTVVVELPSRAAPR